MSGNMYGADSAELEALASELQRYDAELDGLLLEGVGSVSLVGLSATLGSIWRGPRSSDFAALWQSRHLHQVRSVQALLREAANDLRANAEQQRTISSPGSTAVGGTLFGLNLPSLALSPSQIVELLKGGGDLAMLAGDIQPFAQTATRAILRHLDDVGMMLSEPGSDGFNFFRSSKGGLTTAINNTPMIDVKAGALTVGLEAAYLAYVWNEHGAGSSKGAEATVEGVIASAVGFVPGGGIAYAGGQLAGEALYNHTPVGDVLLDAHRATDYIDAAERAMAEANMHVANGDFEAANEANQRAAELTRQAKEEAEGWKGMLNSARSLIPFV